MNLFDEATTHAARAHAEIRAAAPPPLPPDFGRVEVPLELVRFRHLRTPQQVHRIQHLREELSMPAHVRAAPAFIALEKKETRTVSWAHSSAWAASSAPSACCR